MRATAASVAAPAARCRNLRRENISDPRERLEPRGFRAGNPCAMGITCFAFGCVWLLPVSSFRAKEGPRCVHGAHGLAPLVVLRSAEDHKIGQVKVRASDFDSI